VENTDRGTIFIGTGANLPHPTHGSPRRTLEAALDELGRRGVSVLRVSPWYRTAPIPASDQPWYVNAVAEVEDAIVVAGLSERVRGFESEMNGAGRILIRYSGTESLARVMIEGADGGRIRTMADDLAGIIRELIGVP